MFKMLFWVALIGGGISVVSQVIPVYNNNMKIDNTFKGIVKNLSSQSESVVKKRMMELFKVQSVDLDALPDEFLENLSITKNRGKLQIGSEYHVVLWLLGTPTIDPESDYKESEVEPMDKLRLRARMDFDFTPYQETP